MKISHTPPSKPRYVAGLDHESSLHVLALVAQAGWIPAPQFTETVTESLEHPARWTVVISVPNFPPGVGTGPTRIVAKRHAADRLLRHVRPIVNICPATGRELHKTRKEAHIAVERQQMLGLGKPLTSEYRCPECRCWHVTGSGSKVIKRLIKMRKTRSQLPWNARLLQYAVTAAPDGERVILVTAGLGANAPAEHVGQHIALIIGQEDLTAMLTELGNEPAVPSADDGPLVYAPLMTGPWRPQQ